MVIAVVIILAIVAIVLVLYNMKIHKQLKEFNNINQRISNLNVLQEFMNAIGENTSVDTKIKKINDILIERYAIKYSTIVVFDGAEYILKASNVDEKHWETLKNLHREPIFKDSITTATPKYITVEKDGEMLPYQKIEFSRAKSAMFFPLYIENIYIGYWIIESGQTHAFDDLDTTILEVIRENIVSVLKTVSYQTTIENIYRKDQFTGLYSAEYLYGKAKRTIEKYTTSAVCMFRINNLEEINEKYDRKTGDKVLIEVSNLIKSNISSEYIFVRYMGPKFAIVFSGVDVDGVTEFLADIKQQIEKIKVPKQEEKTPKSKKEIYASPKLNFVVSTYYKGTGIESVTKKLEEYLDNADKTENNISSI